MKRFAPHKPAPAGSTLLAVFWVLAVLGFALFTSLGLVLQHVETQTSHAQAFRAEQLMERGLALASHPEVSPGDPLLETAGDDLETLEVRLEGEGARFHLNTLLQKNDRALLEQIFTAWGLDPGQSGELIDRLQDWVDPDDLARLNGAESALYERAGFRNRPFNRPFQSLDEVALVAGMDLVAELQPDWRRWFTLWSGSGKLDLNEALPEFIEMAAGIPAGGATGLARLRLGNDGIPHTVDDIRFQSVEDGLNALGIDPPDPDGARRRLTVNDPVQRVTLTARVGDYAARREVVLRKGRRIQLHSWKESVIP